MLYSEGRWAPARNCSVSNPSSLRWGPSPHLNKRETQAPRSQDRQETAVRLPAGCPFTAPAPHHRQPASVDTTHGSSFSLSLSLLPESFKGQMIVVKIHRAHIIIGWLTADPVLCVVFFFLPKAMSVSVAFQEFVSLNKKS